MPVTSPQTPSTARPLTTCVVRSHAQPKKPQPPQSSFLSPSFPESPESSESASETGVSYVASGSVLVSG